MNQDLQNNQSNQQVATQQPNVQPQQPKKKFRWYIPVLLFFGPVVVQAILGIVVHSLFGKSIKDIQLLWSIWTIIKILCWFAFIPSIIIELIRSNK